MISPSAQSVDMPIKGGYVGMVDREEFDEWLRVRAAKEGATRVTGAYEKITRERDGGVIVHYEAKDAGSSALRTKLVIGADGALSQVGRQEVPGADKTRFVFAYHEIVEAPSAAANRCEIHYCGALSPDFYAWIFPHGDTMSVGVGSAQKGFSLKSSVSGLRAAAASRKVRLCAGKGRLYRSNPCDVGITARMCCWRATPPALVAPASGEGIYYAMLGGRLSAEAGG